MIDRIRRAPARFGSAGMAGDVAWTLAFQGISVVIVFASFMMLGRGLGDVGYGRYVGLFAVTTPLTTVGHAAGLSVVQFTFQEQRDVEETTARFWGMVLGIGVILTAVAVVVAKAFISVGIVEIVSVAIAELLVGPSIRVLAGSERRPRGVGGQMRIEIGLVIVRFAVLAGLYLSDALTVRNVAVGWLIAFTAYLVFLVAVWMPHLDRKVHIDRPTRDEGRSAFHMGAPIFANNFQINGDKLVLNAVNLERDAGLYGAAFKVMLLATLPIQSVESAMFHRFLQSDDDAIGQHTGRALAYSAASLVVVVPVAAAIWLFAPWFDFIAGDEFGDSTPIIRWLTLWLPFQALSGVPLNALMGLERYAARLWVVLSSAAVSMLLYLLLIPGRGWEGAVVGTIASEIYLLVFAWIVLIRAQRAHDTRVRARL